jgi:two-component system, response regulator YesN
MPPLRILIADDNAGSRHAIARYFRLTGHAVLEASTGREAVQLIVDNDVDVAVLDIQMPELNGIEAARCIRESRSSLPIFAFTAWPEMISAAHRHLFVEILIKPISPTQLSDIVCTYVINARTGA